MKSVTLPNAAIKVGSLLLGALDDQDDRGTDWYGCTYLLCRMNYIKKGLIYLSEERPLPRMH